jgi:hypothetical protein
LLVECAWRAIGSDPALTAAYAEFTKKMTKQQAIIKIARKLLNRIRYVWLNEKMYVTGVVKELKGAVSIYCSTLRPLVDACIQAMLAEDCGYRNLPLKYHAAPFDLEEKG